MGKVQKKVKKTNNSAFSATHTYIKLTLVSFFLLLFLCTFPLGWFWELRKSVLLQTKCVRHLFCPLCHHGCLRSHRGGFCFTDRQALRFVGWNYCLDDFSFFDKVWSSFQVFFYAWLKIVDTRRVSNRTDVLSDHWYSILEFFEHKSLDLSNPIFWIFFCQ